MFSRSGLEMNKTAKEFIFLGYDLSRPKGEATFHYRLTWEKETPSHPAELTFTEKISFGTGLDFDGLALEMLKVLYLISGISYYKAGLAPDIYFTGVDVSTEEIELIRSLYSYGLYELAYRNGYVLPSLSFYQDGHKLQQDRLSLNERPSMAGNGGPPLKEYMNVGGSKIAESSSGGHEVKALLPFGGGIDSITSLELIKGETDGISLFVMSKMGDRYRAIEDAAAVTDLPIVRTERELDGKILLSKELGLINGHIPITAIISAAATLAAVLHGFNHVVMSNEKSASFGTITESGAVVNHQWSKGIEFESIFHNLVKIKSQDKVRYFSLLRPVSELWIAERFSKVKSYLPVFRSCNRAFHVDPKQRMDKWCGVCDKCCFIDLILAPFLSKTELETIFDSNEPLANPVNEEKFLALLGCESYAKPFECVGDVTECRAAWQLAFARPDRQDNAMMTKIDNLLRKETSFVELTESALGDLMIPSGPDFIPSELHRALI